MGHSHDMLTMLLGRRSRRQGAEVGLDLIGAVVSGTGVGEGAGVGPDLSGAVRSSTGEEGAEDCSGPGGGAIQSGMGCGWEMSPE